MSLSIRQDLESAEAAAAFNKRISDWRCEAMQKQIHPGCVGEMACIHCYHVISDSICLCIGVFDCPKCGKRNGKTMTERLEASPVRGQLVWIPVGYPDIDYTI